MKRSDFVEIERSAALLKNAQFGNQVSKSIPNMARTDRNDFPCIPGCPVEYTFSIIGGKWKGSILSHLMMHDTMRFNELKRHLTKITQRMLTLQLRELEEAGLVLRVVHPETPPRVEYSLTRKGRSLEPVILALEAWGRSQLRDDLPAHVEA